MSASGPTQGHVVRPSDNKEPARVAFIQCVGSRDVACERGYCSSVCCMYATKEAVIAKEHDPAVQPTIFYIDLRAFGKGFERYIERAEREYGVRYVRSSVSFVREDPKTHNLVLRYVAEKGNGDQGVVARESLPTSNLQSPITEGEFDLVVLSVGVQPPEGTRELAERLGIALNEYRFAEAAPYRPTQTARAGVFVAGAFGEPKDIPETVIEASCAAAQVSALLAEARGTLAVQPVWPEERDVSEEPPRVGVFICHCGINIGGVVDVPQVVEYAASLPGVVYAERNLYTCSQDTQQRIRERIQEHGLNRVVVASCTPRTHEPLFQETLRAAGLNPHLFEMTNIREQDSWVHRTEPQTATEKAKELVAMAVAKARRLRPIEHATFDVDHRALVIGGGLAGMTAALSIAEQGFGVTLVEREPELGGNLRHIHTALPGTGKLVDGKLVNWEAINYQSTNLPTNDPQALLTHTVEAISSNPRVTVLTGAEVVGVSGYVGQYRTTVRLSDGRQEEIPHGAIVVATGARQTEPREYLYGQDPRIITQRELERQIADARWQSAIGNLQSVVMIQCVGSRDDAHPYCSRICCTEAIKNALALKELNPEMEVVILYRDVRAFGFKERAYTQAREKGVVFLRYEPERKPVVEIRDSRLQVVVQEPSLGEEMAIHPDLVVLSAGIEPNADNARLAQLVKVPLSEDGFFLEAHAKLRPLEFAADGVYLCGMAHSPRFLDETIAQAQGAAIRAVSLLSRDQLEATPITARVNPRLCTACGLCVEICPYGARVLEPGAKQAEVIEVLCQGCGACVVACPNKASQQKGFETVQVYEMLNVVEI